MKLRQMTLNVSRQNVSSALAAILASMASVITLMGGDSKETNYIVIGSAVTTM